MCIRDRYYTGAKNWSLLHSVFFLFQVLVGSLGAKNYELLPAASKRRFGQVLYYFPPRVMVSEEKFFYTFLSLMAEIGGYVGLLLGVSLFHFADWLSDLVEAQIEKYEKKAKAAGQETTGKGGEEEGDGASATVADGPGQAK